MPRGQRLKVEIETQMQCVLEGLSGTPVAEPCPRHSYGEWCNSWGRVTLACHAGVLYDELDFDPWRFGSPPPRTTGGRQLRMWKRRL